jgi:hypothetical protein
MKAADLQQRLAELAPGESLLLSAVEIKQAFAYDRTPEGWRAYATALAKLYQCSLTVCGPDESLVSFVRYSDWSSDERIYRTHPWAHGDGRLGCIVWPGAGLAQTAPGSNREVRRMTEELATLAAGAALAFIVAIVARLIWRFVSMVD